MDLTDQLSFARQTYNASSRWFIPDDLLYFQGGLNPLHNYEITIKNTANSLLSLVNGNTGYVNDFSGRVGYVSISLTYHVRQKLKLSQTRE